jgi:hypothetical protein
MDNNFKKLKKKKETDSNDRIFDRAKQILCLFPVTQPTPNISTDPKYIHLP